MSYNVVYFSHHWCYAQLAFLQRNKGGLCPFLVMDKLRLEQSTGCMLFRTRNNTTLSRFTAAQICGADNMVDLLFTNLRNLHLRWSDANLSVTVEVVRTARLLSRQPLPSPLPQALVICMPSVWVKATKQNTFVPCNPQTTCVECKTLSGFLLSQLCPFSASGGYGMHPTCNKTKLVLDSCSQDPFTSGSSSLHPSSYF